MYNWSLLQCASPCLWNQLPSSLWQPHSSLSDSDFTVHAATTSSQLCQLTTLTTNNSLSLSLLAQNPPLSQIFPTINSLLAKTAEPISLPFKLWTWVGRRKHKFNHIGQVAPMCPHGRIHWHNLPNMSEPSICRSDAALCQNYFDHLLNFNEQQVTYGQPYHTNSMTFEWPATSFHLSLTC